VVNKNWKLLSRKKVYDGSPYINIFIDKVRLPNGNIIDDYHRIEVNNAVMLLVENEKSELLVYNEYRHGIKDVSYTFPAGGIEKDETINDTAKRELLEEMGYEFNDCKLISKYVVSGSYMFSELNFVSIKGIKKVRDPSNIDIENPEYLWLRKDLVINAIKENKFKGLTYVTAAFAWLFYYEEEK
jgi:ADP-ribose pyrophosphatase|tara:strand:- start:256 stop:810 length:555 start_codon:yes stop_codon:yes gene_type:complete